MNSEEKKKWNAEQNEALKNQAAATLGQAKFKFDEAECLQKTSEKLLEQSKCDHEMVAGDGGFWICTDTCKKCGFEYDY